jgi:hypothetical protein
MAIGTMLQFAMELYLVSRVGMVGIFVEGIDSETDL